MSFRIEELVQTRLSWRAGREVRQEIVAAEEQAAQLSLMLEYASSTQASKASQECKSQQQQERSSGVQTQAEFDLWWFFPLWPRQRKCSGGVFRLVPCV